MAGTINGGIGISGGHPHVSMESGLDGRNNFFYSAAQIGGR